MYVHLDGQIQNFWKLTIQIIEKLFKWLELGGDAKLRSYAAGGLSSWSRDVSREDWGKYWYMGIKP